MTHSSLAQVVAFLTQLSFECGCNNEMRLQPSVEAIISVWSHARAASATPALQSRNVLQCWCSGVGTKEPFFGRGANDAEQAKTNPDTGRDPAEVSDRPNRVLGMSVR